MIVLQLLLYCLLFTAMVKIAVIGGAVNGLYFYPKEVQDRAIELGLIDRNTMNRKRKCFMILFWVLPGLEDAPFVQTWRQVLKKRSILALIWVAGAAIVGGIVHLIF